MRCKLAFGTRLGAKSFQRTINARDMDAVLREIARAKERLGLTADTAVVTCYEAGRDGFWLHRSLAHHGIRNLIVDSASIEVNRRARRAKSDSLDAAKLLTMLMRSSGVASCIRSCVRWNTSARCWRISRKGWIGWSQVTHGFSV